MDDKRSLGSVLRDAIVLVEDLRESSLPSNSPEYQAKVAQALHGVS